MAPSIDNPAGFFENQRIEAVHEGLLNSFGLAWDRPTPLPKGWQETENARIALEDLNQILDEEFQGPGGVMCKDPRLCLTAPLWTKLAEARNIELAYAAIVRNPEEVALSLHARNNMPFAWAAQLYCEYNASLIQNLGGDKDVFWISYNQLIYSSDTFREQIRQHFSEAFLTGNDDATLGPLPKIDNALYRNRRAGKSQTPLGKKFDRIFAEPQLPTTQQIRELEHIIHHSSFADFAEFEALVGSSIAKTAPNPVTKSKPAKAINSRLESAGFQEGVPHSRSTQDSILDDITKKNESSLNKLESALKVRIDDLEAKLDLIREELEQQVQTLEGKLGELSKTHILSKAPAQNHPANSFADSKFRVLGIARFWYRRLPLPHSLRVFLSQQVISRVISHPPLSPGHYGNPIDGFDQTKSLKEISNDIQYCESPDVSIIIPVFNQIEMTINCISSISNQITNKMFEIIIIDDCSHDNTEKIIKKFDHVIYHRNSENLGFIKNCNIGAEIAKGKYIIFLNNDTLVYQDWLQEICATVDEHGDVGIVGSMLVNVDGSLQEAGGIIWDDGSGWNWGRGGDPNHPRYNFVREVDYVSGCSLMIERDLFLKTGMFDCDLEIAYYEDTSKSFQLRQLGKRTLYQPHSKLIHLEGASNGTDLNQGLKQYQRKNKDIFYEKYREQISSLLPNGTQPEVASDRYAKGNILIIDSVTPMPDHDSGSMDMYNLIVILKNFGYRVHFVPHSNFANFGRYTKKLQSMGVECIYAPFYYSVEELLKERGDVFDAVILTRMNVAASSIGDVERYTPSAARIYYTVDLHHLREEREAKLTNDAKLLELSRSHKATELDLIQRCDVTLVLSEAEHDLLRQQGCQRLRVLPLLRDVTTPGPKGWSERRDVLFIGGFQHSPNVDAVVWLASEIWPKVRQIRKARNQKPIVLRIIGSNMPKKIKDLSDLDVLTVGFVEDLSSEFDNARLSVAPLRFGAGLKGKLATSFEFGVPAIGTPIAFEGMPANGLADIEISAETSSGLAELIVQTYDDEENWRRLSCAAVEYVTNHYSLEAVAPTVESILDEAITRRSEIVKKL